MTDSEASVLSSAPASAARVYTASDGPDQLELANLSFLRLDDDDVDWIVDVCHLDDRAAWVRRFDLGGNRLTATGIELLVQILPRSPLEYLSLDSNPLGDDGLELLASTLPCCPTLQELSLNNTGLSDICALSISHAVRQSCIRRLHLANNELGNKGCVIVSRELVGHPLCPLLLLSLNGNYIKTDGLLALGNALRINNACASGPGLGRDPPQPIRQTSHPSRLCGTWLREIWLGDNSLSDISIEEFCRACCQPATDRSAAPQSLTPQSFVPQSLAPATTSSAAWSALVTAALLQPPGRLIAGTPSQRPIASLKLFYSHTITDGAVAHLCQFMYIYGLAELDLTGNLVGDDGVELLCEYLESNSFVRLARLHLGSNYITSVGGVRLAQLLRNNSVPALCDLDLSGNHLGEEALVALAHSLEDPRLVDNLEAGAPPQKPASGDFHRGARGNSTLDAQCPLRGAPRIQAAPGPSRLERLNLADNADPTELVLSAFARCLRSNRNLLQIHFEALALFSVPSSSIDRLFTEIRDRIEQNVGIKTLVQQSSVRVLRQARALMLRCRWILPFELLERICWTAHRSSLLANEQLRRITNFATSASSLDPEIDRTAFLSQVDCLRFHG
ncbi:uncharacterized protein BJ171DRAFT_154256 [Polychytrium aggregatum]|uniref:uncharacterized protein n=1 Tax=Polychytrium aggregatum TaxID=110093 RepID=UPI0022FEAD68|nr:uncharacterized protein BJ171DRAFT_154256 [Polychytrium aggregatum]KAI9203173.1 hypothetical protein BJ171DRAFT_154256 [Polychytrium aggregatum]